MAVLVTRLGEVELGTRARMPKLPAGYWVLAVSRTSRCESSIGFIIIICCKQDNSLLRAGFAQEWIWQFFEHRVERQESLQVRDNSEHKNS